MKLLCLFAAWFPWGHIISTVHPVAPAFHKTKNAEFSIPTYGWLLNLLNLQG
jgi:hypothetical protein